MNRFTINGVSITGGRNVTIRNGKITVDGVDVTPDTKDIKIEITGNVDRLEADACNSISITGNAGPVATQSGDVRVGGSVCGSVRTMSGDVDCDGPIYGSCSTMSGDIKHR